MATIETTVIAKITDHRGQVTEVKQTSVTRVGDNPRFLVNEAQIAVSNLKVEVTEMLRAKFGPEKPTITNYAATAEGSI